MQTLQNGSPMERIAMDIMTDQPETDNRNKHILVIADYYTKWTEAFPMENLHLIRWQT